MIDLSFGMIVTQCCSFSEFKVEHWLIQGCLFLAVALICHRGVFSFKKNSIVSDWPSFITRVSCKFATFTVSHHHTGGLPHYQTFALSHWNRLGYNAHLVQYTWDPSGNAHSGMTIRCRWALGLSWSSSTILLCIRGNIHPCKTQNCNCRCQYQLQCTSFEVGVVSTSVHWTTIIQYLTLLEIIRTFSWLFSELF